MRTILNPARLVSAIATAVVAEVDAAQSLRSVAEELAAHEVGVVIVRASGRPVGLVSERDVIAALALGADPWATQAADVMTPDLITGAPTDSIGDIGMRMLDTGIRHVVLCEDHRIVGVVSIRDILRALLTERAPSGRE